MVEGLRKQIVETEDYPRGSPIRAILEEPAQKLARIREAATALPTPEQFLAQEKAILEQKGFSEDRVEFPSTEHLDEDIEIWRRTVELGFTTMQAHILPGVDLANYRLPKGWVKPRDWYFQQIGTKIDKDSARLRPMIVLIDTTPKPNYDRGRQLYPNDSFGPLVSMLRESGEIAVLDGYKHVPTTSRFAVTPIERETSFDPALARILALDPDKVRIPTEAENNFIGNVHHPELGQNTTWEWRDDRFEDGYRLYGGYSDYGGLAYVRYDWSDNRYDRAGFRPLAILSS